jgi:hypothetical protein
MEQFPLAKIIRIQSAHFEGINNHSGYDNLVSTLESKGFQKAESSKDNFYEVFEHPEYNNEEKNTVVSIGVEGKVIDVKFTVSKAPSIN